MYTEWTKIILNAYEQHREVIQDNIGKVLNTDGYIAEKRVIKEVSKIWWISLCAVGRGGILHPYEQEIDPNTLITIAESADIQVEHLIPPIAIVDSHIRKCDSGEVEPNGIDLYILPIYAIVSAIDKGYDMDTLFHLPELDQYDALGNIGLGALGVGGDAWVKVISNTIKDFEKKIL